MVTKYIHEGEDGESELVYFIANLIKGFPDVAKCMIRNFDYDDNTFESSEMERASSFVTNKRIASRYIFVM